MSVFCQGVNLLRKETLFYGIEKKQNMRINAEIKSVFLVLDSRLLPVERNPRRSTYSRGGAAQPKVRVLTVMCQQENRPEIQAGALFTPPSRSPSQLFLDPLPSFAFDQMPFPFLSAVYTLVWYPNAN